MTKTFGAYSPLRKAGSFYYVSGQVGIDPDTGIAGEDIVSQTRQSLANLGSLLSEVSLSMDNVVKTTIYLIHMSDFDIVNSIYADCFTGNKPARSCVQVAGLPKVATTELHIEIEAVAYDSRDSHDN